MPPRCTAHGDLTGTTQFFSNLAEIDAFAHYVGMSQVPAPDSDVVKIAQHGDDLHNAMLRHSCAYFAQEVLTGPPEPPYRGRFFINEHHEEWDQLVANYKRICILAARDHGKTFFWDFAYPIWKAFFQPKKVTYIFSATKPQASRILEDILTEIESNPILRRRLMPSGAGKKWSSGYARCSNGHRFYAHGFGTKVRGAHPHHIIVDDGLNDEDMYSELVRRKHIEYFRSAITNMIVPGGQIIVVGTPFHAADLYGMLEKNPEYETRRYPAVQPDGKALWPERYDEESLARKKREIGSIAFTREFGCQAVSDEMSLFPRGLFQGPPVEQYRVKLGMPYAFWEQAGVTIYMGVDLAISSNVGADFFVIFVIGVDSRGNRWIVDIFRKKGLAYQKQLSYINGMARKYEPALILIESNQMQKIYSDELIRLSDLPIKDYTTGTEKHMLDKGVPGLRILAENGKFRIPRGDQSSVERTDVWITEMNGFTIQDGRVVSVTEHDDTGMACWLANTAVRLGGFNFSMGDEDGVEPKLSAAEQERQQYVNKRLRDLANQPMTDEVLDEIEALEDGSSTALDPFDVGDISDPLESEFDYF
jgi:hypothetical protein